MNISLIFRASLILIFSVFEIRISSGADTIGVIYHKSAYASANMLGEINEDDLLKKFSLGCQSKDGNFSIKTILIYKTHCLYVVDELNNNLSKANRLSFRIDMKEIDWIRNFDPDVKLMRKISSSDKALDLSVNSHVVFSSRNGNEECRDVAIPVPIVALGSDGKVFEQIYSFFNKMDSLQGAP